MESHGNKAEDGMKLSTKGRYAMVALADLALTEAQAGEDLMSLAAIAKRQDLSLPYLCLLYTSRCV